MRKFISILVVLGLLLTLVGCDSAEEVTIVTVEEALEIANFDNEYVGLRDLYFNGPQDITQETTMTADEIIYLENTKSYGPYVSYLYISEDPLFDGLREYLYTLFSYERMIEGDERVAAGEDRNDNNIYLNFLCSYVGGSIFALEYFYFEFSEYVADWVDEVFYHETGTIFFSAADGNIYSSETVLTTLFADELDDMRDQVDQLITEVADLYYSGYLPYVTYVHCDALVEGYQGYYSNYSFAMYDMDTLETYVNSSKIGYFGLFVGRTIDDLPDDILFSRGVKYHVEDTGELIPCIIIGSNGNDAEQGLQISHPSTTYVQYDY